MSLGKEPDGAGFEAMGTTGAGVEQHQQQQSQSLQAHVRA